MRYSKQELFSKLGKENQKKLQNSTISIIGIGALGTITLNLLARAGVGNIKIFDRDLVELSNLQRQTLFDESDIGKPKVFAAKDKISKINSEIKLEPNLIDLNHTNIGLIKSDLILDCTDNIYTKFLINDYCKKNKIKWIYSSVLGSKGRIMVITDKTPCFSCIFKEPTEALDTCDTLGIINTIPNLIASMQATEAIKILTNQEHSEELICFDIWNDKLIKIKTKKSKSCKVCNKQYEYLNGTKSVDITKVCGSCNYQLKIENIENTFKKLSKLKNVKKSDDCLMFGDIIIFKSGRALVKADTEEKAKIILAKYLG